jgi:glycosyltransferase involved in cell wall biosynthesis
MPFFTPLWAEVPVAMLIFQLAREVWWYESRLPMSAVGYAIEPTYLKAYRRTPVLTISKSTEEDLRRLGFTGPITIVPIGIQEVRGYHHAKTSVPTFLYVGRLAPSKRIGHIVEALALFRQANGSGQLWLVGTGSQNYMKSLQQLARTLDVDQHVTFWGRVSEDEKQRLMSEAHALVMTSVREGWGLVVTEANACGTPAVVYDVPGLRDSVLNEITGLVVPSEPPVLCAALLRLVNDPKLYKRLSAEGRRWSETLTFENSAAHVDHELRNIALSRGRHVST